MDLKYPILVKEEWYIITSNDTEERIALPITIWRKLELLRKESQWTLRDWIKSLMNHHVEPPWRTPVIKEWSNERKEKLKTQGESLQWLDEALRRDKVETWNSRRKDKASRTNNVTWWTTPTSRN